MPMLMYMKNSALSGRNRVEMSPSSCESLPVSAMIVKQGKNFTTAKIFKKVCKTLFVSVTILSPNFLLNDRCFKSIVDTRKITENFHMTKVTFLQYFCGWALTFSIQIFEHIAWFALLTWRYVITSTLKRYWPYHIIKLWQTVQSCILVSDANFGGRKYSVIQNVKEQWCYITVYVLSRAYLQLKPRFRFNMAAARIKGKGSFYIAQYPVRWTGQSALHFLLSLTDLFIPAPTRRLREAF